MRVVIAAIVLLVLSLVFAAPTAAEGTVTKGPGLAASDGKAVMLAEDDVQVPEEKPKKSKKNPNDNDDKDEDPDDGDAGGGNDGKTTPPSDGPIND